MHRTNFSRIDLNLLVVFDAVAQSQSVTAAADRLSLSQPAVSHALNRLRDLVGDRLFVRSGNGFLPTPRAEAMILPVRQLLAMAHGVLVTGEFDPAGSARVFHVGASDYAALTVIPELVRALRDEAPGVTLKVVPPREQILAQLESGELDCSLWGAQTPRPPFLSQELFREHFVGLVSARHPLAVEACQGTLTLDDFLAHPHMMVTFRDPRLSPVDAALEALGRRRRVAVIAPNFASNIASLSGTDLIMCLPSRLANSISSPDLIHFPLPLEVPDYPYSLIWHERTDGDPTCAWLRRLITEGACRSCQTNDA